MRIARLLTKTQFGSPEMLWVVSHVPGWLGVMTPDAGNNRVGWIAQNATALSRESWELKVSLAARRLTVLHHGKVVVQWPVAIGAAGSPTPTGRFAVTDRIVTNDPDGPYGCCILAISAHAPHAIQGWVGGTRIAIHSTPEAASIGEATSHGCVRVTIPDGHWLLAHIPLGTPTLINSKLGLRWRPPRVAPVRVRTGCRAPAICVAGRAGSGARHPGGTRTCAAFRRRRLSPLRAGDAPRRADLAAPRARAPRAV